MARNLSIAILASGSGSNAENIILHARKNPRITIPVIITDNPQAFVIERVKKLGVPCDIIAKDGSKETHEEKILGVLRRHNVDMVFLAGYMRILSPAFIRAYPNRIINIHPSLLPAFPGRDAYGDAFEANVAFSGVTLHYVDEGIDTGPIITQKKFPRLASDTLEAFRERGLELEYEIYREFIDDLIRSVAA